MGMASSQARLLSLTSRQHDVELRAQVLQARKLQLGNDSRKVYNNYLESLNRSKIQYRFTNNMGESVMKEVTLNGLQNGLLGAYGASDKVMFLSSISGETLYVTPAVNSKYKLTDISEGKYPILNDYLKEVLGAEALDSLTTKNVVEFDLRNVSAFLVSNKECKESNGDTISITMTQDRLPTTYDMLKDGGNYVRLYGKTESVWNPSTGSGISGTQGSTQPLYDSNVYDYFDLFDGDTQVVNDPLTRELLLSKDIVIDLSGTSNENDQLLGHLNRLYKAWGDDTHLGNLYVVGVSEEEFKDMITNENAKIFLNLDDSDKKIQYISADSEEYLTIKNNEQSLNFDPSPTMSSSQMTYSPSVDKFKTTLYQVLQAYYEENFDDSITEEKILNYLDSDNNSDGKNSGTILFLNASLEAYLAYRTAGDDLTEKRNALQHALVNFIAANKEDRNCLFGEANESYYKDFSIFDEFGVDRDELRGYNDTSGEVISTLDFSEKTQEEIDAAFKSFFDNIVRQLKDPANYTDIHDNLDLEYSEDYLEYIDTYFKPYMKTYEKTYDGGGTYSTYYEVPSNDDLTNNIYMALTYYTAENANGKNAITYGDDDIYNSYYEKISSLSAEEKYKLNSILNLYFTYTDFKDVYSPFMEELYQYFTGGKDAVFPTFETLALSENLDIREPYDAKAGNAPEKKYKLGFFKTNTIDTSNVEIQKAIAMYKLAAQYKNIQVTSDDLSSNKEFVTNMIQNAAGVLVSFDTAKVAATEYRYTTYSSEWDDEDIKEHLKQLSGQMANLVEISDVNLSMSAYLEEVTDSAKINEAQAIYESEMSKINTKETRIDNQLSELEAERTAIKTEQDSVKNIVKENVDLAFKVFN